MFVVFVLIVVEKGYTLPSVWAQTTRLKVYCHAIQCFYVDFFAVENGGEETPGRGAG